MRKITHFSEKEQPGGIIVYDLNVSGDWQGVSELARFTKLVVEGTASFSYDNLDAIFSESDLLEQYLMPEEGEGFEAFHHRAFSTHMGNGIRKGIARLVSPSSVPQGITVTDGTEGNRLALDTLISETSYRATLSASGSYVERADFIADYILEYLQPDES